MPSVIEYSSTCSKELQLLKENIDEIGFESSLENVYSKLKSDFSRVQKKIEEIFVGMEYFGYQQARIAPCEFFSFWIDFIATFKLSLRWINDNKYVRAQRQRRDAQKMRDSLIHSMVVHPDKDTSTIDELEGLDAPSFRTGIMNLVESPQVHINLRKGSKVKHKVSKRKRKRKRNREAYQEFSRVKK